MIAQYPFKPRRHQFALVLLHNVYTVHYTRPVLSIHYTVYTIKYTMYTIYLIVLHEMREHVTVVADEESVGHVSQFFTVLLHKLLR